MKNIVFNVLNALGHRLAGSGLGLERRRSLQRVYESVYRKVAPTDVTLVKVQNHKMYVNPRDLPLGRSLATLGIYEALETHLFRSLLHPGMTIVDIGANVGYYTLIAAELVANEGKVYAFEPDPTNYELLNRNVELNGYQNVETVQRAVSDSSGTVTLYIDKTNFGNRSMGKSNIVDDGGEVEVVTVSLDDFFESKMGGCRVDVLKIDAQGAEGLIFNGARNTLRRHSPKIFMEFEPDMLRNLGTDPIALLQQFASLGYECSLIDYDIKSLRQIALDRLLDECKKNGYVDLFLEK